MGAIFDGRSVAVVVAYLVIGRLSMALPLAIADGIIAGVDDRPGPSAPSRR